MSERVGGRGVGLRLALVLGSLLFGAAGGELGLRLLLSRAGADPEAGLEELLERSERTDLAERAVEADGRLGLRGLVRASPVPELVFELKPGLAGRFLGKEVAINRFGFRGPETTLDKPAATARIALLGDSVAFGWGVGQDETYLARIEAALNAEAPEGARIETLNFGVPGYNAAMEVALYEARARAFAPDLLLVHFVENDLRLPHFLSSRPDPWDPGRSYLVDLIRTRGDLTALRRPELHPHRMQGLDAERRQALREAHRDGTGEAGYREVMARLARMAAEDGVPVVIARLDRKGRWGELVASVAEEHGFGQIVFGPRLIGHLAAQGERGRGAHRRAFWIAPDDSHPNPLAHRLYAEEVLLWLRASGHLPAWAGRPGDAAP